MSTHAGTRSTTENLILSIDAGNAKSFGDVNYISYSSYNVATWVNYFPANTTIITGVDDPNGSNTALRVICANTGPSLVRVWFPAFTPNGTDNYVSSFYARLITPTYGPGILNTDIHDANPSKTYGPNLIANTWVRVETSGIPTAVSKSFIDLISDTTTNAVIDFWGVQLEPGISATKLTETTGTVAISKAKKVSDMSLSNTNLSFFGTADYTSNISKFNTNATLITQQSHLTLTTPISFSDGGEYTIEFWVKLRSGADSNFHTLTGQNGISRWLSVYTNNTTGDNWIIRYREDAGTYRDSSTITSINMQNSWTHIAVTVGSSRDIRFFVNGQFINSVTAISTIFSINSILGGYNAGTANYYPFQGSMVACRVYNKTLSDYDVRMNFNSLRSRFGI